MQKPIFFIHQNVKPSDLDFISTSYQGAIDENFTVFSNGAPGLVNGLQISGTGGSSQFKVNPGVAYNDAGERLQIFNPGAIETITFTGTKTIYARLTQVNYDPNPATNPSGSLNVTRSLNPDTNTLVDTRSYDFTYIDTTGTSSDVVLGQVIANGGGQFVTANSSGSNHLTIVNGLIDIYDGSINPGVFNSNSIDSNIFITGLNYDIVLNTGTDILTSGQGNIATLALPFENIYSKTGTFHQINGMSPIIIDSLQMKTGTSIESTSGKLLFDSSGRGVQFGAQIFTTGISAGISGNITISTPTGNINLQTSNGSVNVSSGLNVAGPATFTNGLSAVGTVDLRGATVLVTAATVTSNASSQNNMIFNSDFSMGIPTYYSGSNILNGAGPYNFKSGLAVLSPWDNRYSGTLTPYNWNAVGSNGSFRMLIGTSEANTNAVGINEVQALTTALPPTGGSFYIVYTGIPALVWPTGAAVTGVTTQLPYTVTYTGLQAALELLPNIGSGNVTVNGSFATTFGITFTNALGFKNLPQMSISGNTLTPSGLVVPAFVTTTNGYTPVFGALKDPTVYTDGPGLNHFARISGSNTLANGSGIYFSVPADTVKPLTDYNVSLYYKNIFQSGNILAGFANASLSATFSSSPLSGSSFVDLAVGQTGTAWQRLSAKLTSPAIDGSTPEYLLFKLEPSGVLSANIVSNIAGVQLTEGSVLSPYINTESEYTMYDPNIVTDNSLNGGWAISNVTSARRYFKNIANSTLYSISSGQFYSPGAMATISAKFDLYGTSSEDAGLLTLDGVTIDSVYTGADIWHNGSMNRSIYIPRGKHSVGLQGTNIAGAGGNHYFSAFSIKPGVSGIMAPKVGVTFN